MLTHNKEKAKKMTYKDQKTDHLEKKILNEAPFSSLSYIRDAIDNKHISLEAFYETLFNQLEQKDAAIDGFLTVYKNQALSQAKELDHLHHTNPKAFKDLGALAGLPIAIKDNIHIKGEKTTCAYLMLDDFVAPFDATVIKKLKDAGMIFVGKTNMDEFAMGSTCETSAYKATKNPWDTSCTPGGSSGGSAAVVAADILPVSLGSDTGGSIRQPAAFCGISGLKPTYGTVSRYGLVAFASSLDQIGPLARRCDDLASIYKAISGSDTHDATTVKTSANETGLNQKIEGKTFAVPSTFIETLSEEMQTQFEKNIKELERFGATCKPVRIDSFDAAVATYYILAPAEASSNLSRFDGVRFTKRAQADQLSEMIKSTRGNYFGDEVQRRIILGTYVLSAGYYDAYYNTALKARSFIKQELAQILQTHDAILCPTTPSPSFELGSKQDPLELYMCDTATIPANISGFPALSIPSGLVTKRPVGIQFIGKPFDDYKLLGLGCDYQEKTPYHLAVSPLGLGETS